MHEIVAMPVDRGRVQPLLVDEQLQHGQVAVMRAEVVCLRAGLANQGRVQPQMLLVQGAFSE